MLSNHIAEALRNSGHRLLVTGASGWLGKATIDLLHGALGQQFHDRVLCFGSTQRTLTLPDSGTIDQYPLEELGNLQSTPSLLLHFAFLTKDRAEEMDEADYRAANGKIGQVVLDCADRIGVEAAFVASSGAAALADSVNASAAMRLYGSLKRDAEDAFADWAQSQDKRLVLARIFNLSGPHINKLGSYALASFIVDALAGGPILVRAPHGVVRGYVAVRELMSLAFGLLLRSDVGIIRFDSGGEPVELGALAETVAAQFGGCSIERPERVPGEDRYLGDAAAYRLLLREEGIESMPLAQQIADTAAFLSQRPALLRDRFCRRNSANAD